MRYAYFDTTPQIGIVTETLLLDEETRTLFARVKNGKHGVVPRIRAAVPSDVLWVVALRA